MERFIKSKIAKVVAVVTILLSMFATYLPLNSRAEDEAPVEDYVTFNATCAAGATVQSDASIAFNYNWRLTGVQTGFKNVHLIVENGDTQQPYANITLSDTNKLNENSVITNAGNYATVDYGNVRNGTDFSGQALVRFGGVSDFEDYTKSIKLIFEADYRDPIQGGPLQHRRIEVPIIVTVQTATEVDSFAANVKIELNKFKDDQTALSAGGFQQFSQDEHLSAHYAFKNGESEYAIDQVRASYKVKIDAENICYGKYILTLQKSKEFDSVAIEDTNSAEALAIDLSQVPNVFTTQIDRKQDGSTDIILTYKTKKDNYTIEDMDDVVNFDFNIYATYHINYAYSLVVPITSTRTETITTTETVERKSSVTNEVTDGQGNKLQGFYNSATCTVFEYGENGYGSSTTTTYTPISYGRGHDGAYFTKDHQAAGSLNFDNLKVATINKLNGLRLAEGEGEAVETVTSHVTGVNSSTSTRTEIDGNSTITYDTTVTETTKEIKIDKTEDKIISTIGSNIQITGRYTAETEGLNLYRDKNGVRIEKRVLNYTNSSECNFLSASIPAVHSAGSEIYGRAQLVDTYLSTLTSTNKIDVTYQTIWNINEREERPQGETNPDLYVYNYNVEGPEDILDEYNDEHETEVQPSGNISYTNSFRPSVSYRVDDSANSEIITKELTTNIMKVKSIKINVMPTGVNAVYFYKKGETTPFFTATSVGDEYIPAQGENIYEYYTKTRLTNSLGKVAGEWDTEWEIDVDQLKAATNMTDENVRNICEVGRRQMGIYSTDVTVAYNGLVAIDNPDLTSDKISFFTLNIGDFNTINTKFKTENKTITLKMYKDTYIFRGKSALVYAVNPTFYVRLPEIFDIDNLTVSMNRNPYIYINNTEIVTASGEKYLKIDCTGTYNSRLLNDATVSINFDRTLKDGSATSYQSIYAYMITENENYYNNIANSQLFEYNNTTPAKMGYTYASYSVEQSQLIQAITSIKVGRKSYKPNSEDGVDKQPEKGAPAIVTTGKTVTYIGELNNAGKALTNASLLFKLPVQGNSEPTNASNQILEANYKFPDGNTFVADHQASLNTPLGANDVVNQISRMTNVADITVYGRQNGRQTTINPSRYTIYYANSLTATVDTDISEFTAYDPDNSDLSNATAILVVMNSISRGENITLQLTMDMPNEAGMVGAEFGAKYTQQGESTPSTLNSEAAFVINGLDRGTLEIQKVFEGYAAGTAPAGIDFSNVKFKLQDEDGNFVQDNGSDAIATANSTGKVTFANLEPGRYKLVEVTNPADIPGYGYVSGLTYATIEAGETKSITAVEPKLQGTIKIVKKFEDTNEIKGTATFVIADSTNSENSYRVTTNEEGIAEIVGLPYGEYIVTEVSGVQGYGIPTISNVILNDEVVTVNVTNPIGKGTIVINKTVPAGQSVTELKFQIDGRAMVSYVDLNDDQVILDKSITLDLSQDYSSNPDIDVVISTDQTSAVITLSNLPLGLYTVTEIDIPTITQESTIKKYIDVTRSVELKTDGQSENVDILNRKKVGYIHINKTAFVGEGDNAEEIGDRSIYSVRVTGTSYYGTVVDQILAFNEDGVAEYALEIGTYNVKETAMDGYDIYYKNDQGTFVKDTNNAGKDIEIKFSDAQNKGLTTNVDIRNNLIGTGYLRVEKSLEGVANPQTVIDAGIKFKVTGRNLAGGRVEEVININQIDNVNNVAYGISGPLSVLGEYELEEVASTVPDYYEAAASRAITISTANTQANPRVERVTNTRGKGTLQMLTQTNPEGGELRGIQYRATEIKFNGDGTYTKLDGTNGTENTVQLVNGSNAFNNTSYADIQELNAGYYYVELVRIPDGYKMDQPQIVEVPTEGIGVAIFTIDRDEYVKYNRLIVNKQILNNNNEIATAADGTLTQVNVDESFEVKLTNTTTNKVYYTYAKPSVPGIIENLPAGTYEVVEEYKPRFNLYGLYNVESGITTSQIEKNAQDKYLITIVEGTQDQQAVKEITIKNKINTNMPIGGYSQIDNYGTIEIDPTILATQSVVYVVDENGDALPGVEFKLVKRTITYNAQDEEVITDEEIDVGTEGNRLVSTDKRITIKGVNPGSYMLVCTKVPEGYLMPKDKQIQVYSGVTQVSRVEIQEDKPRASLTLSTTYVNKSGDTKYVPLSKYKVVDKATGELVKFTRTSTGDYVKSNLEDANVIITVKSGEVEIDGLEVGTYEVGLVGVTDGYALQKDSPETVTLVQNDDKHINVEVVQPKVVQIGTGYYDTMWLDSSGQLWVIGDNYNGRYGNPEFSSNYNAIPYKIEFPEDDVFITSFDDAYYCVAAIDSLGRVWAWGANAIYESAVNTLSASPTPICITNIDDTSIIQELKTQLGAENAGLISSLYQAYNNGVRFVEAKFVYSNDLLLIDSDGKLWSWGNQPQALGMEQRTGDLTKLNSHPTCVTDMIGNPLYEEYNQGIKIAKLAKVSDTYNSRMGAIDSVGRVWMWGNGPLGDGTTNNSYTPICISDIDSEFASAEIVELSIGSAVYALDKDGNVWVWGANSYGELCNSNTGTSILSPTKLSNTLFNGARIKAINMRDTTGTFIDEYGKVWVVGYCSDGEMGSNQSNSRLTTPYCVSDNSDLNGVEGVQIDGCSLSHHTIVLDNTGRIWGWGGVNNYGQVGSVASNYYAKLPHPITADYIKHLEYNLRFKKVLQQSGATIALDENGDVWGYGNGQYIGLGHQASYSGNGHFTKIPTLEGKHVIDISMDSSSNASWCALTEDGQVYICGSTSYLYKNSNNDYYLYAPTDITNTFNFVDDAKIIKVRLSQYVGVALDSKNRVWTFGTGNNYETGNGSSSYTTPICLSLDSTNPIYNKQIIDIDINSNGVYAIDKDGKIWYWGSESYAPTNYSLVSGQTRKPICISDVLGTALCSEYLNGNRFVDVEVAGYGYAFGLDENGKLWIICNSVSSDEIICASDSQNYPLYNESLKYDDYKIETIIGGNSYLYIRDNKGTSWYAYNLGFNKVIDQYNVSENLIDMCSGWAIDNYGQLWQLEEGRALSVIVRNPLYNIKIKEILSDGRVKVDSDKGEIYKLTSNSANFEMYGEEYITEHLGINTVKLTQYDGSYNGINSTNFYAPSNYNYQYKIALDENGKMWTWGGNYLLLGNNTQAGSIIPVCINDIQGTELYTATQNGTKFVDFVITTTAISTVNDVSASDAVVIALDNNNKVWIWGYEKGLTPICLTDRNGNALNSEYNQQFSFETIYKIKQRADYKNYEKMYAIDNSGELWALTENPICLTKTGDGVVNERNNFSNIQEMSEFMVGMIQNGKKYEILDGKLWYWSGTTFTCLSSVNGSELKAKYDNATEENPFSITKVEELGNNEITYAIDNYGKLWTWGYNTNGSGILGNGTTSGSSTPQCISDINGDLKNANVRIQSVYLTGKKGPYSNMVAIDENGDYWVCGNNSNGQLGTGTRDNVLSPRKITITVSGQVKKIRKFEVYDTYCYTSYSSISGKTGLVLLTDGTMYSAGSNEAAVRFLNAGLTPSGFTAQPLSGRDTYSLTFAKMNNIAGAQDFKVFTDDNGYYEMAVAYGTSGAYVWGYNRYYNLGIGSNTSRYLTYYTSNTSSRGIYCYELASPTQNTYMPSSIKAVYMYRDAMYSIGTDGKIYVSYDSMPSPYRTICLSTTLNSLQNVQIKDIMYYKPGANLSGYNYFEAENGDIYWIGSTSAVNMSNSEQLAGKTIVDKFFETSNPIVTTSDGKSYQFDRSSISEITSSGSSITNYTGDAAGKNIVQATSNMAIDDEGNLYAKYSCDGLYDYNKNDWLLISDKEISRKSDFQYNNTVTNATRANTLVGKKYSDIINDQIVKDSENDYWFFPSDNSVAINISKNAQGEENPLYNKTISRTIGSKYVITSENEVYRITGENPEYIMNVLPSNNVEDEIYYTFNGTVGKEYYIGLDKQGKIWTAGDPYYGQLGNGRGYPQGGFEKTLICISDIEGTTLKSKYDNNASFKITNIYRNGNRVFALDNEGNIWSWGYNNYGMLGNNTSGNTSVPICLNSIEGTELYTSSQTAGFKIVKLFILKENCFAVDSDGKLWAWGRGAYGALGNNSTSTIYSPKCITDIASTDLNTASQTSGFSIVNVEVAGYYGNIILTDSNGDKWVSGQNSNGHLGTGNTSNVTTFKQLTGTSGYSGISDVTDITIGNESSLYTLLTCSNGDVWVAGNNNSGRFGTGNTSNITTFMKIKGESNYTGISNVDNIEVYSNYVMITDSNGDKWVAGYNNYGQWGTGDTTNITTFRKITGASNYTGIDNIVDVKYDTGLYCTILTCSNGDVWIAGTNSYGRLGTGNTSNVTSFIKMKGTSCNHGIDGVDEVIFGKYQTMLKCTNGDIWVAGYNNYGQFGNGTTTNVTSFVKINGADSYTGIPDIADFYIGQYTAFAIDSTGNIWAAGNRGGSSSSQYSYLGDGAYTPRNQTTFICVSNIANTPLASEIDNIDIVKIAIGISATFILDSNGDVWATGRSQYTGFDDRELMVFTNLNKTPESPLYGKHVAEIDANQNQPYVKLTDGTSFALSGYGSRPNPFETDSPSGEETVSPEIIAELESTEHLGKGEITEIIDDTHVRCADGKTYAIADDGTLTAVDSYTPGSAPTYTEPVIPNVTVVDYSNYKALDADGNLYVWNQFTGGFKNPPATSTDAINLSEEEYTVAPVIQDSNGWSAIRASY